MISTQAATLLLSLISAVAGTTVLNAQDSPSADGFPPLARSSKAPAIELRRNAQSLLVRPERTDKERLPLVIFAHGGGGVRGSQRGYQSAAIRWLRAHAGKYYLDPTRFGITEGSASGNIAVLTTTTLGDSRFEGPANQLWSVERNPVRRFSEWDDKLHRVTLDAV